MRIVAVLAWLSFNAAVSTAAVIARDDPYAGDFRTFGEAGCSADNQGVGTIVLSRISSCTKYPLAFKSIATHGFEEWQFIAHTTENCADKGTPVFPTASGVKDLVCTSAPGGASFVAFSVIKT